MEKDKIQHFFISYTIAVVGMFVFSNMFEWEYERSVAMGSLVSLIIGWGKEIYDKYVKKTKIDKYDLFADLVGVVLAIIPTILVC